MGWLALTTVVFQFFFIWLPVCLSPFSYLFCAFWFISCSVFSKGCGVGQGELTLVGALGLNQEGVLPQTAWGLVGMDLTMIPAELPYPGNLWIPQFLTPDQMVCSSNCVCIINISGLIHPLFPSASIYLFLLLIMRKFSCVTKIQS